MTEETKALKAELRATRKAMKQSGIKRLSCFNGGHSAESYRLNAECFRLETLIKKATA